MTEPTKRGKNDMNILVLDPQQALASLVGAAVHLAQSVRSLENTLNNDGYGKTPDIVASEDNVARLLAIGEALVTHLDGTRAAPHPDIVPPDSEAYLLVAGIPSKKAAALADVITRARRLRQIEAAVGGNETAEVNDARMALAKARDAYLAKSKEST